MNSRLEEVLQGKEENYILPFFWQHGETEEVLRQYVNVIHDSNIRAFCIESRPHPDFGGPKWWQDLDIILDEAKKLNMKVWILDDSHFPTGFANGAVLKSKDVTKRKLYLSCNTVELAGPVPQTEVVVEDMIHPPVLPPWIPRDPHAPEEAKDDRLYHIYACKVAEDASLEEPVLLDSYVQGDRLIWDIPEGYWRIFFTYLTRDARGRDDYINFLDRDSCRLLIDAVYEPHWEHYKEEFGKTIAGFFSDEPPIGNTAGYTMTGRVGSDPNMNLAWSDAMEDRFDQSFGDESWTGLLPYLWGPAEDKVAAAKVRYAYMDSVTRLVQECFSNQLGSWCQEHGVLYIGHMLEDVDASSKMGPSMGHFFRGLDGQHMAGIDNIGNSLEIGAQHTGRHNPYSTFEGEFYHYTLGKLAASHASMDPKKKGRAMCENFGAYGWETGVRTMKYLNDELLVRGINYFVPHAFSPKDFPDPDCPPHFYAHGENPQYRAFGDLMKYTNRVAHLISGGKAKPSVALLYHGESDWAGEMESNSVVAKYLTKAQIDFHILPADVLVEKEKYKTVFDGKTLTVNGVSYKALVLSACDYISRETGEFIEAAEETDFPVICTGRKLPEIVGSGQTVNARNLLDAENIGEYLKKLGICDVTLIPDGDSHRDLTVYHYQNGDEIYLLLNENPGKTFRGKVDLEALEQVGMDGTILSYDAWTNETEFMERETDGRLRLEIEPLDLAILIIRREAEETGDRKSRKVPKEWKNLELSKFTVQSAGAKEYPVFRQEAVPVPISEGRLKSYSSLDPDFSGWLRYRTEVDLDKVPGEGELLLEECFESAYVLVNGQEIGSRTAKPYRFRLGDALKEGKNEILIDVATTPERHARKIGADVYCMNIHHPLKPTGILGKIRMICR